MLAKGGLGVHVMNEICFGLYLETSSKSNTGHARALIFTVNL